MINLSVKIYNPCWGVDVAADWGVRAVSADVQEVLNEPFKIAMLPVMWNQPGHFTYSHTHPDIRMNQFDLVILSDIESSTSVEIYDWLDQEKTRFFVAALGAKRNTIPVDDFFMVYRPWWMYNLMRLNQFESTVSDNKPYLFDVLLGARRPHRDYVMMALQKHRRLLDNSIVTYRDVFAGGFVDDLSQIAVNSFPNEVLQWPYVSKNLKEEWEVTKEIKKNISPFLPYKIYQQTWFTVVCETHNTADSFFLTEKTSKPLFAKRPFVFFGPMRHLANLKKLGFKTFDSVIDESYDEIEIDDERYRQAFNQMLSLSQQDPGRVMLQLNDILEHNHNRMWQLQQETQQAMQNMLLCRIPSQYVISID
jgi:hypothetical protein